jgi:predicted Zn-dependent protease
VNDLAAQVLERVQAAEPAVEVQVSTDRHRLALTRFANSVIHQNVAEDVVTVRTRVHLQGRTASAATTVSGEDGLAALVQRTLDAVRVAPLDPGWPGLAPPSPPPSVPPVDTATAAASPADRAAVVRAFVDAAGGLETAGYCRTDHWTGAFANSLGHAIEGENADVAVAAIARRDGCDGVARSTSRRLADIDGGALGARAAAKANASIEPVELPPGRYEVVLEPTAVADVLEWLSAAGFNAKAVAEGRSFVRLGDEQFDASVRLVDDATAAGWWYDADGTPHRRLVLVDGGTSVALTHDRRTAAAAAATSTGHGIGMAAMGARAMFLALEPSDPAAVATEVAGPVVDSAAAELVSGVERGVLVSDLWYTRVLDPRTLAITGLTRNGVWLIEGGEVTTPLRNFRFTQSYAQALMPGAVKAIGRAAAPVPGDSYVATSPRWTAPALHLASWNFTGGASG